MAVPVIERTPLRLYEMGELVRTPLKLYVAGDNSDGQLGTGDKIDVHEWTEMEIPQALQDEAALEGYEYFPVCISMSRAGTNRHAVVVLHARIKEGA